MKRAKKGHGLFAWAGVSFIMLMVIAIVMLIFLFVPGVFGMDFVGFAGIMAGFLILPLVGMASMCLVMAILTFCGRRNVGLFVFRLIYAGILTVLLLVIKKNMIEYGSADIPLSSVPLLEGYVIAQLVLLVFMIFNCFPGARKASAFIKYVGWIPGIVMLGFGIYAYVAFPVNRLLESALHATYNVTIVTFLLCIGIPFFCFLEVLLNGLWMGTGWYPDELDPNYQDPNTVQQPYVQVNAYTNQAPGAYSPYIINQQPAQPQYTGQVAQPQFTGQTAQPQYTGQVAQPQFTGQVVQTTVQPAQNTAQMSEEAAAQPQFTGQTAQPQAPIPDVENPFAPVNDTQFPQS